jgi:hypothetical protein
MILPGKEGEKRPVRKPAVFIVFDILLWLAAIKCFTFVMIFTIQMLDPSILKQLVENVHIGVREWIIGIYQNQI